MKSLAILISLLPISAIASQGQIACTSYAVGDDGIARTLATKDYQADLTKLQSNQQPAQVKSFESEIKDFLGLKKISHQHKAQRISANQQKILNTTNKDIFFSDWKGTDDLGFKSNMVCYWSKTNLK